MRKLREILRLKYALGRSHREIAKAVGIGAVTVSVYVRRARECEFTWPLPDALDDLALERDVFPDTDDAPAPRPEPDWAEVHRELRSTLSVRRKAFATANSACVIDVGG